MNKRITWNRKVVRHLPLCAAIIGMALVFSALAVFSLAGANVRIAMVAGGILFLLGGIWYAANPYLSSERSQLQLRAEVDGFIGLVRELSKTAAYGGAGGELENVKSRMHNAVDRMVELARTEGR